MRSTTAALKTFLGVFVLCVPIASAADERPLDELIERCVVAGGLGRSPIPGRLVVLDPAKLRDAVKDRKPGLPLDQRAALNGRCLKAMGSSHGLVALLRAVADGSGDDLTLGWAAFWEGDLQRHRHESPEAIASFEAAAVRFASAKSPNDRGNCYSMIAIVYSQQGDSRSALIFHRKALELFQASGGGHTIPVAACLKSIAFTHANLGEKDQALASMRKGLAIFEAIQGPTGPGSLDAQASIGGLYYLFRDYERSAEVRTRLLPLIEKAHGRRSSEYAAALEGLADLDYARSFHAKAVRGFGDVLAIRQEVEGPRSSGVAATLLKLARARDNAGDRRGAVADLTAALGIVREVHGPRSSSTAEVMKELARVHDDLGDHRLAIGELQDVLEIERALYGERHISLALTHVQIARTYERIREVGLALREFRSALEIVEKLPGSEASAVAVLGMISTTHLTMGQPDRAVEAMEGALKIVRRSRGEGDIEVSRVLTQLGEALMQGRDYVGAIRRLDEALAIQRGRPDWGGVDRARTLIRMGRVHQLENRLDPAESAFREAMEILRAASGETGGETMLAKTALARVIFDRARYAEAAEAYRGIIESLGRDRGAGLANDLKMLGAALARSGQLDGARTAYGQAVEALRVDPVERRAPGLPGSSDVLLPLEVTVQVLQSYGWELETIPGAPADTARLAESLKALRLAADVVDRLRERLVVDGPSKLLIGERQAELFPSIVGLCARLADLGGGDPARVEAFEAAERGAARVFLESLARAHAASLGGVSPEFLADEATMAEALARLDQQIGQEQSRPIARRDSKRVASLLEEQGRLRGRQHAAIEQAERDFPAYASLKYPRPCTLDEARAVLADDEVAFHYILGDERSYLIVVEKKPGQGSSGVALHVIPARAVLSRMVAALLVEKTLKDPEATREKAAEAFRLLIGPASAAIRGKSLVIVPGGILGKLPFEMLVEPSDDGVGRYLIERHRIRYAPSMTALDVIGRWDRSRPAPTKELLAIGDPVYDRADERLAGGLAAEVIPVPSAPKVRFDRLAGSGIEVERIAGAMGVGPGDRMLGSSATEGAIKRLSSEGKLGAYRYVHFATHGMLGEADGTQPALVLSLVGIPPGEDGNLRLDEVTVLRLNADLVVLSACGSGQGQDYRLEGVTGLARAVLYAGSRGVVCSLWRVDDAATADLMVDFYGGLKAGLSAAEALRTAQLRMIGTGEPPLHWAPFVLIGR